MFVRGVLVVERFCIVKLFNAIKLILFNLP